MNNDDEGMYLFFGLIAFLALSGLCAAILSVAVR